MSENCIKCWHKDFGKACFSLWLSTELILRWQVVFYNNSHFGNFENDFIYIYTHIHIQPISICSMFLFPSTIQLFWERELTLELHQSKFFIVHAQHTYGRGATSIGNFKTSLIYSSSIFCVCVRVCVDTHKKKNNLNLLNVSLSLKYPALGELTHLRTPPD